MGGGGHERPKMHYFPELLFSTVRKGKRFTKNKEFIRSQTVNPLTSERKNKGGAANNPEGVGGMRKEELLHSISLQI